MPRRVRCSSSGGAWKGTSALLPLLVTLWLLAAACSDDSTSSEGSSETTASTSSPTSVAPDQPTKDAEKQQGEQFMTTVEIDYDDRITDAAAAEAEALRLEVIAAVEAAGWSNAEDVAAAGYVPMFGDDYHLVHREYVLDEAAFDATRPEFLVVDDDGDVVGVMFLAQDPDLEQHPPPGSPLLKWHYHEWATPLCLAEGLFTTSLPVDGQCAEGEEMSTTSPLMTHVWLNSVDPFATAMDSHQH